MNIHERLRNWGRWARDRKRFGFCGSIEHKWRSPQCWYPPEPKVIIDHRDAEFIREVIVWAVVHGDLNMSQSWALHYEYIEPRFNRWKAATRCKVFTPQRLERLVEESVLLFKKILEIRTDMLYATENCAGYDSRSTERLDCQEAGFAAA